MSGFEKKLERSFPELYRKLKESTEGGAGPIVCNTRLTDDDIPEFTGIP